MQILNISIYNLDKKNAKNIIKVNIANIPDKVVKY